MNDSFITIAITSPHKIEDEGNRIIRLLDSGEADIVHIRKPGWDILQTRLLISKIPLRLRSRLKIHDHFSLADELKLGGIHLNSRNPDPGDYSGNISRSCHSIEQLDDFRHYEYMTLSPVFDSISKTGYKGRFDITSLRRVIEGKRIVALGGVTPDKFPLLKDAGFHGAAMLGYFWR